jgi:hypothetical protein
MSLVSKAVFENMNIENGISEPVKLNTRPWDPELGAPYFSGTSWFLSEVLVSFC